MQFAAGVFVAGCSIPSRDPAVPRVDTTRAQPLGIPNARFYADADPKPMIEEGTAAVQREVIERSPQMPLLLQDMAYPGHVWLTRSKARMLK